MKKTVEYFACIRNGMFPGVENKLRQTVTSLNDAGYSAELKLVQGGVIGKYFRLAFNLLASKSKIIIIRNCVGIPVCLIPILALRLIGRRVIIDVPTPIATTIIEIKGQKARRGKLIRFFYHLIFPVSLWPASRVLQYSEESGWFSAGLKRKTKIISNGIRVLDIPVRTINHLQSDDEFTMVAVASIAEWHGYDRLIRGIASYQLKSVNTKVRFILVGEGDAKLGLEILAKKLGVENLIEFPGKKIGNELDTFFSKAHVAVSSLGLFRKGLTIASDLKSREYAARGIPFIFAGEDIDFLPPPSFVKIIPNDSTNVDIEEIINWYLNYYIKFSSTEEIRRYALDRLDYSKKILSMLE